MNDLEHIRNIREMILRMTLSTGNGGAHLGPALSCVEILYAIYKRANITLKDPDRDRVILSKGHGGMALYAAQMECGLIPAEKLAEFEKNGGDFPGQPSKNLGLGIDCSTGSLGMGLSYASGILLGNDKCHAYVVVGDGELNEGSNWECAMFAGFNHQDRLTVVVDYNKMQADGDSNQVLRYDVEGMFNSCGFATVTCDGHSVDELSLALNTEHAGKPLAVIANTVKGKGVSFAENNRAWHHSRLTPSQFTEAMKEIGGAQ